MSELELIPLDAELADRYLPLVESNIDRLARWEPWAREPDAVASLPWYLAWCASERAAGRRFSFAIANETGLLGSVSATITGAQAELGYWLAAEAEGAGVASRAIEQLVSLLPPEVTGLIAATGHDNTRSRALLERCGFALIDPDPGAQPGQVRYARDRTQT